jgi:hypothetical protein
MNYFIWSSSSDFARLLEVSSVADDSTSSIVLQCVSKRQLLSPENED